MERPPDDADGTPKPPPSPGRAPTSHSTHRATRPDQSLESFAITTTPFHEPDEDGEYYMDEAGNWMQRWVVKTEVQAAKAAPSSRPDSGYEETSLDSSESSTEERRLRQMRQQSRGRPPMRRQSRSSVITADKANHRSPAPSASPRMAAVEDFADAGRQQQQAQQALAGQHSSDSDSSDPSATAGTPPRHKALSCPSSPRQRPVTTLSPPPSPTHTRRSSQPHRPRPALHARRHSALTAAPSRRSTTTASKPRQPLSGASSYARLRATRTLSSASGDPYAAHREALAIFTARTVSSDGDERQAPRRIVQAADFLAQQQQQLQPTEERPGSSQSSGESTLHSFGAGNGVAAERCGSSSEDDAKAVRQLVLADHDVVIDWTHPETRKRREERESKQRRGIRGKVRRFVVRLGGGKRDEDDAGSVRRLKMH